MLNKTQFEEIEDVLHADLVRTRAEAQRARAAYAEAVKEFNELVLHGKIPARLREEIACTVGA